MLGYLPEIPPVYGDMKVQEYLQFVAELKKIDKHNRNADIKQVMDLTKLHDVKDRLNQKSVQRLSTESRTGSGTDRYAGDHYSG